MSLAEISLHDHRLATFLREGGSLTDNQAQERIRQLTAVALKMEPVRSIAEQIPLTPSLLAAAYAEALEQLMPNPLVDRDGPVLAPTLLFLEPGAFPHLWDTQGDRLRIAGQAGDQKEIIDILVQAVQELYRQATSKKAPVPLATNKDGGGYQPGGCASITLPALILLTILFLALLGG